MKDNIKSTIMKLNHANICTSNVTALCEIFTHHFGFKVIQENDVSAILKGSDGFSLILTIIDKDAQHFYPSSFLHNFRINFHVGFTLENSGEVYDKHRELISNGHKPGPVNVFEALGTTWTAFYFSVGDGIDIEVTCSTK